MTVQELIEKLQTYPQDLLVVTPDLDSCDYDDVSVSQIWIALNQGNGGHCGIHKEVDENHTKATLCINISPP